MHWPQYMIKITSVRPSPRETWTENRTLTINEKIKRVECKTAETLFARLDDLSWCRTARDEEDRK